MLRFVVTFERVATGERFRLVTDADADLLEWPRELPKERLLEIAAGQPDPTGEFRFLYRALKQGS